MKVVTKDLIVVLLLMFFIACTVGIIGPYIALHLAGAGAAGWQIGILTALPVGAMFFAGPFVQRLAGKLGSKPALLFAAVAVIAAYLSMVAVNDLWCWAVLLFVIGLGNSAVFAICDTAVNTLAKENRRGRIIGGYTTMLSAGYAVGPALLAFSGTEGTTPLLLCALFVLCALLLLIRLRVPEDMEQMVKISLVRIFKREPVLLTAIALVAALDVWALDFVPLLGRDSALYSVQPSLLATATMCGAIIWQLPIGWLADRMHRERLLLAAIVLSGLLPLFLPLALEYNYLAYGLLFVWGGALSSIFTLVVTLNGERHSGSELLGYQAALITMEGFGNFAGPLLAGGLYTFSARYGLVALMVTACLLTLLIGLRWRVDR
ncbi:MAG: MFS transporter [Negativicutes bacterium]|jgi:MFS family permease